MAVGQAVLVGAPDVAALTALELRLEQREVRRSAEHAGVLRDVLALQALFGSTGHDLATVAHVALLLRSSEFRAAELLSSAQLLVGLPGAFEALECGLLTVEQVKVVVGQLLALPEEVARSVWERLQTRLIADEEAGVVRPPARLRALLARWVVEADADAAARRRRQAQETAGVDYRRRQDGLVDLFAYGLSGPDAQACLARIRACSAPVGIGDDRAPGRRRSDALVDLILGRERLRFDDPPAEPTDEDEAERGADPDRRGRHGAPSCGCRPGQPAPCGAEISVLVPLGAALGTTGELAELVGHGALEPDLLTALLLASPRLRVVWVDQHGVPVAARPQRVTPTRGDPGAVREALIRLAHSPPPDRLNPRHPDDHRPPEARGAPGDPGPHPPATPGPYRIPAALRRVVSVRRPLCEWPGCGVRADRCDLDHDLAWPDGPTCACNVGPLCRRHHRIKQLGWVKERTPDAAVRWTGPTGRGWTSPVPHDPAAPPERPLPALPTAADPLDSLSPLQLDDELRYDDHQDPATDDPAGLELRTEDTEPTAEDLDPLEDQLLHTDTRWSLDLDDPYAWLDVDARPDDGT